MAGERPRGNTPNGERIFWASCGGCHRVNDRGGRLGPDLSQIASSQSRESLLRSIRDASASIASGYEPVTLVTRDGQRIRGVRKGEDAFSIQIMDTRERLQGYVKAELREVSRDTQSLMPSFGADRLSDADLDDLLDFLSTLRSNGRVRTRSTMRERLVRRTRLMEPQRPQRRVLGGSIRVRSMRSMCRGCHACASSLAVVAVCLAAIGFVLVRAQESGAPDVTYQDLLDGLKDPSRWLMYSGDYNGQRHSPLKQITPENVSRLTAQWTYQTGTTARGRGFEATPLVLDGVVYVTGPNNFAWALDARTGRPFWQYRRDLPNDLTYGASAPVNRGFGVFGDKLFMVTLDAHLLALDMKTGAVVWDVVLADYKIGYSATLAPLVIKDKVIVGHLGQRLSDAGIPRRLRSEDRRAHLAVLYGPWRGRDRQRNAGRRRSTCWRAAAAAPG